MPLLAIEPVEFQVELPEKATKGLGEYQLLKMRETVQNVRKVDGAYKIYVAKQLWELRGLLRGGKKAENPSQWTAFKKSGVVPFSSREIQDLVVGWEWVKESGIEEEMLNTVGIRTLALIANSEPAIRKQIEGKLMSGEQVSRNTLAELQGKKQVKKPDTSWQAYWAGQSTKIKKLSTEQLRERVERLEKKNFDGEKERKELQSRINSLKIRP